MQRPTLRQVIISLGICSTLACFGGSCSDDGPVVVTDPSVSEVIPCKAAVGEDVVILGSKFFAAQGRGYVRINGMLAPVKSWEDRRIVATVPAGATTGPITVVNDDGGSSGPSSESLEVGARFTVPEIEPNDSVNGGDATPVGRNMEAAGTLANVGDKDHFRFDCIHDRFYKIKVSPPLVSVVYVNGSAVPLTLGEGTINGTPLADTIVVGLTGGTGNYTVSIEPFPAP